MSLNLDAIPVIDTHTHPFPPELAAISWPDLRNGISVGFRERHDNDNDTMLLSRMMLRSLGRLLDVPATPDAVIAARNERATADPVAWTKTLFADVKIEGMLVDPGFPVRLIEASELAPVVPCPVYEGYRIERFAAGPAGTLDYDAFPSFAAFIDAFRAKLDEEAAKPGMVFYKSVIAYLTGLAIGTPGEAEASAAWSERPAFRDPGDKVLRDFLFRETALKAIQHNKPFQIHTGHTGIGQPWRNANPIELTPFLNSSRMEDATFVLVHGGYPFNTEAGHMTVAYPNVFLDFSLMIPWSSTGVQRRIEMTLEQAPTSKLMYGSDGIVAPEMYWIAAKNGKRALGQVLDGLVTQDVIDEEEGIEIAHDVLHRTAKRVYGVDITSQIA